MDTIKYRMSDGTYVAGLVSLIVSLALYCLPFFVNIDEQKHFGLFIGNYAVFCVYHFIRVSNKHKVEAQNKIHHLFLSLILFLVSAYSLNRQLPVFEDSATWFALLLVLVSANFLSFAYFDSLPLWARHTVSFVNAVAIVTFIYLAIYVLPLFAFGLIGILLLGVGLHAFVPALFVIYSIILQNRMAERSTRYWRSFLAGIISTVAFLIVFLLQWNSTVKQIDRIIFNSANNKADMPGWIKVSQKIPRNDMSQKVLKGDLVYSVPEHAERNFLWGGLTSAGFNETRKHDPLVMIASAFAGQAQLEMAERIKILQSIYNMRHDEDDRLWSGNHLHTSLVNTAVRIWPNCNIAYTEKTVTVTNRNTPRNWSNQEEAIYTFYMPEGAVVTSLSLWVNGKEEKGILTTKALADTAYKTIVGRERRDPSVVHWQEGNSVSVRVFPVINGESRMFKLGITAPLQRINGKLRYENVYFKGPAFDQAKEDILIDFEEPINNLDVPTSFVSLKHDRSYKSSGRYEPDWSMELKDPGLSNCAFSFGGSTYSLTPYHKKLATAVMTNVYIDVNTAWTRTEYDKVLAAAAGKNVFAYTDELVSVTDNNKDEVWKKLKKDQFSHFPFQHINEPTSSIVITKNAAPSPELDDLEGTSFLQDLKAFVVKNPGIKLYNLGNDLSLYLRSLKEFRIFKYDTGSVADLNILFQRNHFPEDTENDNTVIIHQSDIMINKVPGTVSSAGPDHLMRLFSYNHIMQKLGNDLLTDRSITDSLVEEARAAYVVTPVSSLVVLESQKDYERFEIHDSNNSLHNASLASKGAVPEPHEWALIILAAITLLVLIRKKRSTVAI